METQTATPAGPSPPASQAAAALRRATQAELKLARIEIHGNDDMAIDDDAMVSEIEGSSKSGYRPGFMSACPNLGSLWTTLARTMRRSSGRFRVLGRLCCALVLLRAKPMS
jgi:hypothetical protein